MKTFKEKIKNMKKDNKMLYSQEMSEFPSDEKEEVTPDVETETEVEQPVKVDRTQRRIDKLTKNKYDLEAKVAELEGKLSKVTPDTQSLGIDEETLQSFVQEEGRKVAEAMRAQAEQETKQKAFNDKCNKIFKEGSKENPDFAKVVENLNKNGFAEDTNFFVNVVDSDNPVKLINYLNDNLDEMDELIAMDPKDQLKALAKLDFKLGNESQVKMSNAPEPIKPLSVSIMAGEVTPEKDLKAWMNQRNKAVKKR